MANVVSAEQKRRREAVRELWPNLSVRTKARVLFRAFGVLLRRPFGRTRWVAVGALLWTGVSIYISVRQQEWGWFERSGSILTLAGAVLAGRAIIREGREGTRPPSPFSIRPLVSTYYDEKTGKLMARTQMSPEEAEQRRIQDEDAAAVVLGLVFAVVGTIVWGYGVPIAKLLGFKTN